MSNALQALLPLVPLLSLLALLLFGRYPGHNAIVRLAERSTSPSRVGAPANFAPRRTSRRAAVAGSLLVACSLASRPPPLRA